ncbi:MAG: MEKHLA domain-containing protein [Oculatellaceae cyanobacterium Prado106]|jgi:hypothetical protein|nr:MEKHLA domain-containing protein [Oculatellaceae cyanobacterium Prado106]
MVEQPWEREAVIRHSQRLQQSFLHWVGRPLLVHEGSAAEFAQALFEAPFVVVSHGTEADPIFNYGNRQALTLWELDWETFTHMPSRQSAPPIEQESRAQLLAEAKQQGYISNYRGIRRSHTHRSFWIENVILWDLLDEQQQPCGQAAQFSQWTYLQ